MQQTDLLFGFIIAKTKRIILIVILLLLGVTMLSATEEKKDPFILFVSSYNPETSQTARNISAFLDEYTMLGGEASSVIIENMNCQSFSEATLWKAKLKDILDKYKNANIRPDLMVLLGQEAWSSYLSLPDSVTSNIPVMCGLVSRNALFLPDDSVSLKDWTPESIDAFSTSKRKNIVSGYAYVYDIKENLKLIKNIYPETKNIAFISDNTYGGVAMQALVRKEMQEFPDLHLIQLDGRKHSIYSIASEISALPANTAILLGTWRIDTNDGYFMSNATYAMKEANPKVPPFTVASIGLGYWAIGGYMPTYMTVGGKMAQQAYDYLNEQKRNQVQIEFIPGHYSFDVIKVAEKGIPLLKLPAGSTLVNRQETFFDKYKYQILIALAIFLIILIGFIVSLYYYIRTKRLKDELELSEKELRVAKNKAEEANHLKTAFIANMSHEIRTPLNAIIGFSNLLVTDESSDEQKSYFEIVQTNTDLLLHLINDILDISRLESGKMKFVYENCEIVSLCQSALSTAEHARRTSAQYLFSSSLSSYMLRTDVQRLQQVLNNLLSNAGKFTQEGSITVACEPNEDEQMIYFSVTDTGTGIPEEKQKLVFERFEKLNEYVQGTGLGLAITKLIVEKLGGRIWVDSDYKEGARFVFTHPMHVIEEEGDEEIAGR